MRLLMLILSFPILLSAQSFDVGIGVGGALYNGDLSVASAQYVQQNTHPAIYLNAAYHLNDFLSFRTGFLASSLSADDALSSEQWQLNRNLNFTTSIYELSAQLEVNLWTFFDNRPMRGMPYAYMGGSVFSFNPKANYNGQLVPLQPLGTEGQGMPGYDDKYDLRAFTVLFGFGYKYDLGNGFVISTSFGWRRASTDYLDDVSKNYVSNDELYNASGLMASNLGNKIGAETGSQRGGSFSNDWYNVGIVSVNYVIGNKRRGLSRAKQVGCPTKF